MRLPTPINLLAAQLRYVGRNVPYFRESGCDGGQPVEDFPFTFKSQIRNNYASFISDEFRGERRQLVDFLTGENIHGEAVGGIRPQEVFFGDNIVVAETTGTSGTPLRCPKTLEDRFRLGVGIWRQRRSLDSLARPGNLFPMIHAGLTPLKNVWDCDLSNLKLIYKEIREGGYRWLHSMAHLLQAHVEVFRREGWYPELPELKFIEFTGHFLHQKEATSLSGFFGAQSVDYYAMLETWAVAIACRHGVLHINEHNVHVEIIDERDRPVRIGELGRIVVTSLQERLLPFVRYVTDDFGMFIEKACDCKLGSKALALAEGRSGNLIKGVSRRVFGDHFYDGVLRGVFRGGTCPDLSCICIRQVAPGDFIVQTNAIREPTELMTALEKETETLLGGRARFQHIVLTDTEVAAQERQKPWLFRCEC